MYLPVPVIESTSSVFLGVCVTHQATVVDIVVTRPYLFNLFWDWVHKAYSHFDAVLYMNTLILLSDITDYA